DIYSFGNEYPYRLELFGNEVDSIRIFDPESQLSKRRVSAISILPNIEQVFQSEEKVSFLDLFNDDTVFVFKDFTFVKERIEYLEENIDERLKEIQEKVL